MQLWNNYFPSLVLKALICKLGNCVNINPRVKCVYQMQQHMRKCALNCPYINVIIVIILYGYAAWYFLFSIQSRAAWLLSSCVFQICKYFFFPPGYLVFSGMNYVLYVSCIHFLCKRPSVTGSIARTQQVLIWREIKTLAVTCEA